MNMCRMVWCVYVHICVCACVYVHVCAYTMHVCIVCVAFVCACVMNVHTIGLVEAHMGAMAPL